LYGDILAFPGTAFMVGDPFVAVIHRYMVLGIGYFHFFADKPERYRIIVFVFLQGYMGILRYGGLLIFFKLISFRSKRLQCGFLFGIKKFLPAYGPALEGSAVVDQEKLHDGPVERGQIMEDPVA